MIKTTLHIEKMDCPEEMNFIKKRLQSLPEIQRLDFNLIQRELTITHEFSDLSHIQTAIKSLGIESQIKQDNLATPSTKILPSAVSKRDWIIIAISGVLAISAEVIAFTTAIENSLPVISLVVASMLLGGRQTFLKGLRAIRNFTLNMNFLMSIAIMGAIAIGEWPEAAMVTFLFALAELIEVYSLDRARLAISGLVELAPDTAIIKKANNWQIKPVSEITVDTIIWVKPCERIPMDGVITKGQSIINQASITGESIPVDKKVGDSVFAGTLNERGSFEFRVTGIHDIRGRFVTLSLYELPQNLVVTPVFSSCQNRIH